MFFFFTQQKPTPLVSNIQDTHSTNYTLRLLLQCFSLCSFPPYVTVEETGVGQARQLMMKNDPVICGLSAAEDVRESQSSDL